MAVLPSATPVQTLSGCTREVSSIALIAFAALLPSNEGATRRDFLARVAVDTHVTYGVAAAALKRMTEDQHPDARTYAMKALSSPNDALRGAGLRALQYVGLADDFAWVAPFAESPDICVREDTAIALGGIWSAASCDLLLALSLDPEWRVSRAALEAYGAHPLAERNKLQALLLEKRRYR